MKTLIKTSVLFFILCLLSACHTSTNEKKIGIIVPLENKALDEIVAGFSETLRAQSPYPLQIKVANAQGDLNMQRAIIAQMKAENYDVIAPIGTGATQMTLSMVSQQNVVSLAADFSEADRKKQNPCHTAVVHDEISPAQLITFIHETYPNLKHIVLVHSASDKIFPDVKTAVAAGKQMGMEIKPMMAATLNDLYSVANAIPDDAQAIFVLKDILITSGISTLENIAEKRHIPLITSDQGSVQDGAAFALGVHEREIGVSGAKLTAPILAGKPACSLPIVEMTKLTVFVNEKSLTKENQPADIALNAAKKLRYAIEFVDAKNG